MSLWEPTADELAHIQRALYLLRIRVGPWSVVAKALHLHEVYLREIRDGERTPSPKQIGAIADMAGIPLPELLRGKLSCCPRCGFLVDLPGLPPS